MYTKNIEIKKERERKRLQHVQSIESSMPNIFEAYSTCFKGDKYIQSAPEMVKQTHRFLQKRVAVKMAF
jgi:uncharacterized protein (DUF1015 family)